jgi:hypothetical protein
MGIFEPSIFLAIFPYIFISMFPIFGIVIVTRSLFKNK